MQFNFPRRKNLEVDLRILFLGSFLGHLRVLFCAVITDFYAYDDNLSFDIAWMFFSLTIFNDFVGAFEANTSNKF